jgi:hypothetical protein
MELYELPSLLELVTRTVIWNLKGYSINQLFAIPVTIKDLIRVKALRKHSTLSPAKFSALLHDQVHAAELGFLKDVNENHIKALEKTTNLVLLNLSNLNLEKFCACDRVHQKTCFHGCLRISKQLNSTLGLLTSLVRLDLSYNKTIVDDTIILKISETSPNLQQLELDYCCKVTDTSIIDRTKRNTEKTNEQSEDKEQPCTFAVSGIVRLSSLQCLGLSGTSISDLGLTELSEHSKSQNTLKELVLNRCDKITDEGLENVLDTFQGLEILSFAHCKKVTMKSVNKLNDYFEKRKDKNNDQYSRMKQISFSIW